MKNRRMFFFIVLVGCAKLVNTSCPSTCSCSYTSSGYYVGCDYKNLGGIPVLPKDTYSLNFAFNNIHDIDVQFCKEMPLLQTINIQNNLIEQIPNDTFRDCHQLISLYLYSNKIQSIESYTFVNMTNLYELHLYNNEISTIKQLAFVNLPSLRYLYLNNNELTAIVEYTFVDLLSLYYLYLHNNELTAIVEYTFVDLPSLYYLNLGSNPINCDCSVIPFWSWIIERPSIGTSVQCSDGTFIISLRSAELDKCNPDNCQCFNGGKCITSGDGKVVCDCIGQWTGEFCLESQCTTYDCGFGKCFVEPMNGTAQCVCDNKQPTYCPCKQFNLGD